MGCDVGVCGLGGGGGVREGKPQHGPQLCDTRTRMMMFAQLEDKLYAFTAPSCCHDDQPPRNPQQVYIHTHTHQARLAAPNNQTPTTHQPPPPHNPPLRPQS